VVGGGYTFGTWYRGVLAKDLRPGTRLCMCLDSQQRRHDRVAMSRLIAAQCCSLAKLLAAGFRGLDVQYKLAACPRQVDLGDERRLAGEQQILCSGGAGSKP
jgi:hypothetical protein